MHKMKKNALLLTVTAALLAEAGAFSVAQAAEETAEAAASETTQAEKEAAREEGKSVSAGDVVVTASGYEEQARYAPASITVITADEIRKKGYTDFRQILNDVPGVDMKTANTRDGANISIRGAESKYTLILVDGISQEGPTLRGEGNGPMGPEGAGAETTSFIPPISIIDRIEVIKGPMSTLYGSDAMGGVVNVITKKIPNDFKGNLTVSHQFETDEGREDTQKYSLAYAGPLQKDRLGFQLRGHWLGRDMGRLADGTTVRSGDVTPPKLRDWNVGARLSWTPTGKSHYWLDMATARLDRRSSKEGRVGANDGQRYDRNAYVFGAENKTNAGQWTSSLSYNQTKLVDRVLSNEAPGTPRTRANNNYIFDTKYAMNPGSTHRLVGGFRYWKEELEYTRTFSTHSLAFFGEDTWALGDKLNLTYGLRYDVPQNFEEHVSPRAYLVYAPDERWTIKGGVSTGFRAPTIPQSTDGVFSYGGRATSGGTVHDIPAYGNPNLKPETSVSLEIGAYYALPGGVSANITFFQSNFKNKIESFSFDDGLAASRGGVLATMYDNVGKSESHGVELAVKTPIAKNVQAKLGYTFLLSKVKGGQYDGEPLQSTPKHQAHLKIDWDPTPSTNVWFGAEYRGVSPRFIASTKSNLSALKNRPNLAAIYNAYANAPDHAAYMVYNMGISHKLNKDLTVDFRINNLFDKDFNETIDVDGVAVTKYYSNIVRATEGSYVGGRSFWLSLSYDF